MEQSYFSVKILHRALFKWTFDEKSDKVSKPEPIVARIFPWESASVTYMGIKMAFD